jgi:hypothetical protein
VSGASGFEVGRCGRTDIVTVSNRRQIRSRREIHVRRGDETTHSFFRYTYIYLGAVASYLSNTCDATNGYADGRCIFDGREDAIWVGNTAVSSQST